MKPDEGHNLTEKELAKLEHRIASVYGEAAKELQETVDNYFRQFEKRDAEMKELIGTVVNGKEWTERDYKQWRLNQIGRGERFKALQKRVAERYTEANQTAVSYVNDATPGIYSLNRNYAAYTIESVAGDVGFDLWDEQTVKRLMVEQPDLMPYYPPKRALKRGIDLAYGKKQITKSVTSSILQGKSIKGMADDLQKRIPTMNRDSAIRTARTAVTNAQNAGRIDSYTAAQKMGIKLKKCWLATLDGRTRHSHAMLDGQTADIDKPFKVDGEEIMFPGDTSAPGYLVYNCRCTLIAAVDGIDTSNAKRRVRNPETGKNELVSDMTYGEWAGWKEKAQVQKAMAQKAEPPATTEDAIKTAHNLGVKYAQFEKMPLEQVNNAIDAVRTLPKDCVPKVIASGKDVSLVTGRPLGRKADQWWGVTYDYRNFSLRTMYLGYDKTDFDGGLIVGLNTQKFKTLDALTKEKKATNDAYFAKTGRYWSFNTDGKATAYHEIGHCFADVRGLPNGWEDASARWAEESACDLLKKPDEAFAEAWAAYHLGDKRLPDYISEIIGGLK